MTLRFALLGDPVEHSISPDIHRAAFDVWGLDAEYSLRAVSSTDLEPAMRDSVLFGGNVTVPHKLRAAGYLTDPSDAVRSTGACNCWRRLDDGGLAGDNTDVGGLRAALDELGWGAEGSRVLLLGAGGAARAAARTLTLGGAERIEVLNRSNRAAEDMVRDVDGPLRVIEEPQGGFDVVINATSLGLSPDDPPPLDLAGLDIRGVYDMVYALGETAWVRQARSLGIRARDGLSMLVHQAALSLSFWLPDRNPPLDAMLDAAARALTKR